MTYSELYILGNGGFAQELFEQNILRGKDKWTFKGFITLKDDTAYVISEEGILEFNYPEKAAFVLGTGNKVWRQKFLDHFLARYERNSDHFPNIVANDAHLSKIALVGIGNVLCPFSLVNGITRIGDFNLINTYSCVHHDNKVGDNNILSPYAGLMGYCELGNNNFFGVHSALTPRVNIGNDNTISAGEVVFDDMKNREFFQSGIITKKK